MRRITGLGLTLGALLLIAAPAQAGAPPGIAVQETDEFIQIDTDALQARIRKKGYVSGVERGTLLDKKTGAREAGFGAHIMDFLMAPGWRDDGYLRDPKVHGNLPKHYVEGPQICTKARELPAEVVRGKDFVAVRLRFTFTEPAPGLKAGSKWEQTLLFRPGARFILSGERITSVNDVDDLFYRIDMPGHIRHTRGDTFNQVYLSYLDKPIPADAFRDDFAPDARYLYQRQEGRVPQRMIRAYQVKVNGQPGPWLAGMTLDPAAVCEAWCHQRGYVCFIQELHRRSVRAGETFGAAYVVGFFDDIPDMERTYDRYRGARALLVEGDGFRLEGAPAVQALPGTRPLTRDGDLAAQMVAGIDRYLQRELQASVAQRAARWTLDLSSPEAAEKSLEPHRSRLRRLLGVVDPRVSSPDLELIGVPGRGSLVAETADYVVHAVRWPVLEGVEAEGLLLQPRGRPTASVVALPDADQTPEMLVGLAPGLPAEAQFARRLAEQGCRVLVPVLIDRKDTWSGNTALGRFTNQPHREFVYRMAYEMGRHVIGYEIQKVLAAVDWLTRQKDHTHTGVIGYGEGGLVAFYSGALDPRIRATVVAGYFGPREGLWQEPIYRNVWNLLREFGDAEVTQLYAPGRMLHVALGAWPRVDGPPPVRPGRSGAAPGKLTTPDAAAVAAELARCKQPDSVAHRALLTSSQGDDLTPALGLLVSGSPQRTPSLEASGKPPSELRKDFDPGPRQQRQLDQLVRFTQKLMRDSEQRRAETFWSKLDLSSPEKFEQSCVPQRKRLAEEVIGQLPRPTEPPNPQSRLLFETPAYRAYEVTLDLYPDVFAEGILCVPKDLAPKERRPVVVCQHGLEGRPSDVVNHTTRTRYYNSFGSQLADKGYVVFAPQNPYIGRDDFRVLQRKANPLGLSLFSFIVRQHEAILDWLATQPFVDPERMAFYGLSYGGKTAMRVPALLPRYCLSICSGDFNEWIWKNVSVDFRGSYMFTGEYEMPEFDLGHTFNYAEMAALIASRPFMVERGHDDGVGIDEWVAYEYAKVRRLYARLKLPERTTIEFFPGGHEINGQGTFAFLARHLRWQR